MTPLESYYHQIDTQGYIADPRQEAVMRHFQRVYDEFVARQTQQHSWWRSLLSRKRNPIKGLYVWGSVGVGKTWLMDTFYQALPTTRKLRMHFHEFMQRVHRELKQHQGHKNPLKQVAKDLAAQADIICFDEFLVNDIVDAMLLANLLAALFSENITLVTTANVEPDVLYRNGLQRSRFLPAITLIKKHSEAMQLPTEMDYRLRTHEQLGAHFYPLTPENHERMAASFFRLAQGQIISSDALEVQGRLILVIKLTKDIVWFDFQDLCHVPRSQLDYLEIASRFPTVFLSNIPKIRADEDNTVRYLINLVDVFYDQGVKLIFSSAVPTADIYTDGRMLFEFRRTLSRLLEMQSQEYINRSP